VGVSEEEKFNDRAKETYGRNVRRGWPTLPATTWANRSLMREIQVLIGRYFFTSFSEMIVIGEM